MKDQSFGKNMLLFTSYWGDNETFKMLPVSEDCPYAEVIYDPTTTLLVVISRIEKENFQLMPRLDDNGQPMRSSKPKENGKPYKEKRETIKVLQEYYIVEKKEQEAFIKMFAINDTFKYKKFLRDMAKEAAVASDASPDLIVPKAPPLLDATGKEMEIIKK